MKPSIRASLVVRCLPGLALAACLAAPAPAIAQAASGAPPPSTGMAPIVVQGATSQSGIGLGVATFLAWPVGVPAAQFVYDAGRWHVEGMFAVNDTPGPSSANIGLGARFWFHLHRATSADFSLGAGLAYTKLGKPVPDAADDIVSIDAGAQIRAFVVSNVALNATLGLGIMTADQSAFGLGGNLIGSVGATYYFF